METRELLGMLPEELEALVLSLGEPRYRAKQLFTQLHAGVSPENMTNIGKATREKLDGVSYYFFAEDKEKARFKA